MSAQENVNNYKYIIVPKKFDFLKEENQYRVNTFTKFLFEKQGFKMLLLEFEMISSNGLFSFK